jgi:hypothetical protein
MATMEQKYYCVNCGAPTFYSANFCMRCGINFKWITPEDAALQESTGSFSSQVQLDEKTAHLPFKCKKIPLQHINNLTAIAEKKESHTEDISTKFKKDISKLLDSLMDSHH